MIDLSFYFVLVSPAYEHGVSQKHWSLYLVMSDNQLGSFSLMKHL